MDNRRRPFAAIDLHFPFKNTCERLEKEFGHAGPLAFLYLILAAKRAPIQGQITITSEAEFWRELGFQTPPEFTMDAFLAFLGRYKQTSKTPLKRTKNVILTHFEDWQKLPDSEFARMRSARKRAQNTRDDSRTTSEPNPNVISTERRGDEHTVSLPLPVVEGNTQNAADSTRGSAAATNGSETLIRRVTLEAAELADNHTALDTATIIGKRHPTLNDEQVVSIVNSIFTA